jgi:DNA-binding CsgD family transcriptional regulator
MMSTNNPAPTMPLLELIQAPEYALRVMTLIDAIHRAHDVPDLLELVQACTNAMGATASVFLVAIPEAEERLTLQVLLACDPDFIYQHEQTCTLLEHPWFNYGREHDLPIAASQLPCDNVKQHAAVNLARQHGFESALILPTPSAAGLGRFGVLCLGSAAADDFDHEESHVVHLLARSLATALSDWFSVHSRDALQASARLITRDLKLLSMELHGLNTKQIARDLGTSSRAVDSQFQRIKQRMGCGTRKAAAKRAAEYGLL